MTNKSNRWAAAVLAVAMMLTLAAPVLAANAPGIDGINDDYWHDAQALMNANAYNLSSGRGRLDLQDLSASPGTELRIYLNKEMFVDKDGNPFGDEGDLLSRSELSRGRIGLSVSKRQNANLIENVSVEYDSSEGAYISIEFPDPIMGTGRRPFAMTIRLRVAGKVRRETEFEVRGKVGNTAVKVGEGTDYIRVDSHESITAEANLKNVTVDIGGGFTIALDMFDGKKYYAYAAATESPAAANAEVVLSYSFSNTNMARGRVRIATDEVYHVYDGDGVYLGTTGDALPVARAYHMARTQVEQLELPGGGGGRGQAEQQAEDAAEAVQPEQASGQAAAA